MKHTTLRSIGIKCWLVWMSVKIMFNAIEGGKSWQMDANISANRFFSLFFIPFDGNFSSPSISRDTFTRNIYEWTAPIHYELLNSQKWHNVKSIGLSLQLSVIVQSYPSECMLFKWMCTNDNTKLDINAMQCQITSTYSLQWVIIRIWNLIVLEIEWNRCYLYHCLCSRRLVFLFTLQWCWLKWREKNIHYITIHPLSWQSPIHAILNEISTIWIHIVICALCIINIFLFPLQKNRRKENNEQMMKN